MAPAADAQSVKPRDGAKVRREAATPAQRPVTQTKATPRRTAPPARVTEGQTPTLRTGIVTPAWAAGPGTPILPVSITSGLSCVPFVKLATGMNVSGDGRMWWYNAAGVYERGNRPETGSVLAFAASGGMSRGHVAVVSRVLGPRNIQIDHSNWAGPGIRRATVMRNVNVVDVSDRNDWTAVRVQVGFDADSFGRTYPTHGFIYNRPIGNRTWTAQAAPASPAAGRPVEELAEAPAPHALKHLTLSINTFAN